MTEPLRLAGPGEASTGILQVAIQRAGLRKGSRAVEFLVAWDIAEAKLGHELGADEGGHLSAALREFARYWKTSERTVWRDLRRFREVFPEEESPARLVGLRAHLKEARRDARAAVSELRIAV